MRLYIVAFHDRGDGSNFVQKNDSQEIMCLGFIVEHSNSEIDVPLLFFVPTSYSQYPILAQEEYIHSLVYYQLLTKDTVLIVREMEDVVAKVVRKRLSCHTQVPTNGAGISEIYCTTDSIS